MSAVSSTDVLSPSPPVAETSPGRQRIDQLQILRFVAAFAVVLFHLGDTAHKDYGLARNYFAIGGAGVDIFFVLSGFVIAYSARPERGMLHFAGRRIARIVPLYWCLTFGIAAVALLAPKLLQSTQLDVPNLLRSLFFIPYARPDGFAMPLLFLGWTLNYEMFFYAVFALTLLIRPWSPIYACVPILGLVALGSMVDSNSVLFRFYTNPIMLDFVFGVLLFMLWARVGRVEIAAGHRHGFALAATVLGIIGLSASIGPLYVLVHGLSAALLVAAALAVGAPGGAVGAALLVLGNASYSLYLSHPYILQAAARIFDHSYPWFVLAPVLAVAAAAAVAASILLYFSIELPAQRWLLRQWDGRRGEAQS